MSSYLHGLSLHLHGYILDQGQGIKYSSYNNLRRLSRVFQKELPLRERVTLPIATLDFDPRSFIKAPLNIPSLITDYYEQYEGIQPVSLSMHGFPGSVLRSIERVGVRAYTKTKARFNPVVGCILDCSLGVWNQHGIIAKAIEVNTAYQRVDEDTYDEVQDAMIDGFFKNNKPEFTVAGKGERKNAWVPPDVRDKVSALANDAGLDVGAFAIVSLMMILCREECVLPGLAKEFAEQVSKFLWTLRERAYGQKALMDAYAKVNAKAKAKK